MKGVWCGPLSHWHELTFPRNVKREENDTKGKGRHVSVSSLRNRVLEKGLFLLVGSVSTVGHLATTAHVQGRNNHVLIPSGVLQFMGAVDDPDNGSISLVTELMKGGRSEDLSRVSLQLQEVVWRWPVGLSSGTAVSASSSVSCWYRTNQSDGDADCRGNLLSMAVFR